MGKNVVPQELEDSLEIKKNWYQELKDSLREKMMISGTRRQPGDEKKLVLTA